MRKKETESKTTCAGAVRRNRGQSKIAGGKAPTRKKNRKGGEKSKTEVLFEAKR